MKNFFILWGSGWRMGLGLDHLRLRSLPVRLVLVLPWITPSGFNIGIMYIYSLLLRYFVYDDFWLSRLSMMPSMTKEEGVSPGWDLPIMTSMSFCSYFYLFFWILIFIGFLPLLKLMFRSAMASYVSSTYSNLC